MNTFVQTLLLALALGGANAGMSNPSVNFNLKQKSMGSGLDMKNMDLGAKVQSRVNDDLTVGVVVDNSDSPVRSVFGRFNSK